MLVRLGLLKLALSLTQFAYDKQLNSSGSGMSAGMMGAGKRSRLETSNARNASKFCQNSYFSALSVTYEPVSDAR